MKKNVKKWLLGIAVSATAAFAVVASGCSAGDKLDTWYNQLTCEHAKVEKVVGVDATCTEDGYTEHEVCKDCDKELGKKVIKATGHENITVIEGFDATCTTTGKTDGEYCNDCKKTVVEQKTIYALGHKKTYAKAEKETCTTDGHTSGWICGNEDCDYVYSGYELIPATGHDVDENGDCELCGKENAVISLSDVKEGMDLSGYKMRYTVSQEEFLSKATKIGDDTDAVYSLFSSDTTGSFLIYFGEGFYTVNGGPFCIDSDYHSVSLLCWEYMADFNMYGEGCDENILPAGSIVSSIEKSSNYPTTLFEFYYVGLPETDNEETPAATNDVETTAAAYSMNKRAMPAFEELQYEVIGTDKNLDGWSGIY